MSTPTYHRHSQRAEAVCGRLGKRDKESKRDKPGPQATSSIATPEAREALWALACADAAAFARHCHAVQVCALDQLPGWPQFQIDCSWEAALVKAEARALGIRC